MAKKTAKKPARKANAAFMRPVQPDAALAEVVGRRSLRTELTKKPGPTSRRTAPGQDQQADDQGDAALKTVLGGKQP